MSRDKDLYNGLSPAVYHPAGNIGISQGVYGQPAEPSQSEPTFAEIFHGVRSRWLPIVAIPTLLAVMAAVYGWLQDPLYTARSVIEIRGYAPILSAATVENMYGADTRKLEYQKTTIAKLKQPGVAELVLSDESLYSVLLDYFKVPNKSKGESTSSAPSRKLVNAYLGLIDINPVSETSLVEIEATTRDPELSARVANAHASGFIAALRAERRESMRTNIVALELQEAELRDRLTKAERAMADYSEESHLVVGTSGDSKDVGLQKLMGLNELLAQATEKRLRTEALYSKLEGIDIKKSTALDTDAIRDTLAQIETLETQYAGLGQKVTPEYPEMKELKARLEALRNSVARQRQQFFNDLKIKLDGEEATEKRLIDQIQKEEKALNVNSKNMGQFLVLKKESDSLRQLYENVLKQLQETKISASSGVSNIFLSDVARPAYDSAYPKTKLFVVVAAVLGLALGLFYAVVAELLDSRLKTSEEASKTLGVPVLGVLPRFMEVEESSGGVLSRARKLLPWRVEASSAAPTSESQAPAIRESVSGTEPKNDDQVRVMPHKMDFVVVEALKTIRAGILLSSVDRPIRVIAVTSANKGEGKSTLAVNLAACLAQAEYKTLLVDADLRESCLADVFAPLRGKGGVSEMLAGNPEATTIQPIPFTEFLDVLPSGKRPPNPAEMLGSKKMAAALKDFRRSYDFVVIDCPPVLPVADSLMVAHEADGVIVVTRAEKTQRRHAREAVNRLRRVHAHIVGVVVNDSSLQREQTYGVAENYHYFDTQVKLKKAG